MQQNSTDLSYEEKHDVQGQASSRWANIARKEWPEGSGGDSLERRGNTTELKDQLYLRDVEIQRLKKTIDSDKNAEIQRLKNTIQSASDAYK